MIRLFGLLLAVLVGFLATATWGTRRWQADTAAAAARLESRAVARPLLYDPAVELTGLPQPVQRYFHNTLRPGQVILRRMHQVQAGQFQMGTGDAGWRKMSASQWTVAQPPGFVWDARIGMLPGLLNVQVRDRYASGHAGMTAQVLGLFTTMQAPDGPELAEGALQRYLGEAMWIPTALLPSQGVVWEPIDDTRARAILRDGSVTASLDFEFNADGDVARIFTQTRYREENGRFAQRPWEAVCSGYAERGGMRIPLHAEVAWILDGQRVPYFRADVSHIEFE